MVLLVLVVLFFSAEFWPKRPCGPCCPTTMRPTPSMITQLTNGAQLWASRKFRGFEDWVAEHEVEVVVNLLGHQHVRVGI